MRACVQRVTRGSVRVDGAIVGEIEQGLVVLLGVGPDDTIDDSRYLADKIVNLRIFEDDEGKMNRSVIDIGGAILAISQFTLFGDCRKGRRPSFVNAAHPELANQLYESFVNAAGTHGVPLQTGQFQADMKVELVNDGPVTMLIDSKKLF